MGPDRAGVLPDRHPKKRKPPHPWFQGLGELGDAIAQGDRAEGKLLRRHFQGR